MEKKLMTFLVDADLVKRFKMTLALNGENITDVLTGCIRDYINKASVNDIMLKYWKNNNLK